MTCHLASRLGLERSVDSCCSSQSFLELSCSVVVDSVFARVLLLASLCARRACGMLSLHLLSSVTEVERTTHVCKTLSYPHARQLLRTSGIIPCFISRMQLDEFQKPSLQAFKGLTMKNCPGQRGQEFRIGVKICQVHLKHQNQ